VIDLHEPYFEQPTLAKWAIVVGIVLKIIILINLTESLHFLLAWLFG
jgi:hypothetical protein